MREPGLSSSEGALLLSYSAPARIKIFALCSLYGRSLLQYPITLLGRRGLDAHPDKQQSEWTSVFTHYGMMIVLGVAIFPAIRLVQQLPGTLPIPYGIGHALVWLTGMATVFTVLNLAIRSLGAPFAAKAVEPACH